MIAAVNFFSSPEEPDKNSRSLLNSLHSLIPEAHDLIFADASLPVNPEEVAEEQDEEEEDDSDFEDFDNFLVCHRSEDAENISLGTYTDPENWLELMDHLHSLVRDRLSSGEYSTDAVARQVGITEEALFDYLNPNTSSYLGIYFIPLMEILEIDSADIVPGFTSDEDIFNVMCSLTYILSTTSPVSFKHHLKFKPGREYRNYVQGLFIEKLGIDDSFNDVAVEKNSKILSAIDAKMRAAGFEIGKEMQEEEYKDISEHLLHICQYGDFEDLLHDSILTSLEQSITFFATLGISVEELIPINCMSVFEMDEINTRFHHNLAFDEEYPFSGYALAGSYEADNEDEELATSNGESPAGYESIPGHAEEADEEYDDYLEKTVELGSEKGLSLYFMELFPNLLYNTLEV